MLKVGLTGGIASGKSAIGEVFVSLGAHLLKADDLAQQLMRPGMPVYEQVVRQFGAEILNPDKTINRAKLAQAAFGGPNTPPRIQELDRIVHPVVLRAQEEWMDNVGGDDSNAIAVVEAALILEAGARHQFDRLIVVLANPNNAHSGWPRDCQSAWKPLSAKWSAAWPPSFPMKRKSRAPIM